MPSHPGLVLALLALPLAAQETRHHPVRAVHLEPVRDNTLYEDLLGGLSNGAGFHVFAGLTESGGKRRALLAFDVAGAVPAGAQVLGVKLTLHVTRTIAGPETVSVHRALADWGEGTSHAPGQEGGGAPATAGDATWLHASYAGTLWSAPGGDFDPAASATRVIGFTGPQTWKSPALVADVQGWLDDPSSNHGWLLLGDEPVGGTGTAKRFGSREGPTAFRPVLKIVYEDP